MRLGLRSQLLLVSSLLLAIPLLGLRAAREIEAFLVETQEQGLISSGRAIATALHERPGIFIVDGDQARGGGRAFRIPSIASPIVLDGAAEDWTIEEADPPVATGVPITAPGTAEEAAAVLQTPNPSATTTPAAVAAPPSIELRAPARRFENSVYLLFEVKDDDVVRQRSESPRLLDGDGVELAVMTSEGEFLRFAIHESGDGSPRVSLVGPGGSLTPDQRLEAVFVETDTGYRIEARAPHALVGARLGFVAHDIDDGARRVHAGDAGQMDLSRPEALASVFTPSPELAALAKALGRGRSRLWVVDSRGRVLAQAGSLQSRGVQGPPSWRQQLVTFLRPLYGSVLIEPTEDFFDQGSSATELVATEVREALAGKSMQWRRRTSDGRAVVLSAAEPVWRDGRAVGAVLAEETTNETLAARNRAFERLFFSVALALGFGALALILFASRLSSRIRGLRNAVERAAEGEGPSHVEIPQANAGDEVGDLSRSFASMLERQRQYTSHLEGLRSRLSHEIRTPVAVVRSSLDNLRLQTLPDAAQKYLDRADEGLSRLVTIVERMTEASRLEETIASAERVRFDIGRVVTGCVLGYRVANPERTIAFEADAGKDPLMVEGSPDLVAQLLDKLVENALDFATPGTPIEIRLTRGLGTALLSVANAGPVLPEELRGSIFDSMVSSRAGSRSGEIHLGLGLSIVKTIAEFHRATASAADRRDPQGVQFLIAFPLAEKAD